MNSNPTIAIWLLRVESLVVDKKLIAVTAERELSLGGWKSDHIKAAQEIDSQIEFLFGQISKYS